MTGVREHTGKYAALWRWLTSQSADRVRLRFADIEDILGFSLPPSSRDHAAHWYSYGGSAVGRAVRDAGWRAASVNLTAETVELYRSASRPAVDELAETLARRDVDDTLAGLLLGFAEHHAVEVCTDETLALPLGAAHDAYAATYVHKSDLAIALDVAGARVAAEKLGLRLETKTATTSYVHVGPGDLADPHRFADISDLLEKAFDRSFHGPRWTRGLPDRKTARGNICQSCFMEMPLVGPCPNCS